MLDTDKVLRPLWPKIQHLPGFTIDDNQVLDEQLIHDLLGYLAYQKKARDELVMGCYDIVHGLMDTAFEYRAKEAAEAMAALGEYIFEQLNHIHAYKRGYLFYQFKRWVGNDILLVRFVPNDPQNSEPPNE